MKKNNKKGFTLVELVIVVAVMAVLVAVAIPTVGSIVNSAKENTAMSNARTIGSMIKLYMAEKEATVSDTSVKAALDQAKLGIEEGEFVYCDECGTCYSSDYSDAACECEGTQYTITYDAGVATIS